MWLQKLDFQQSDITWVGDAIEVRLNAWHEDLSPVLGGVVHALRFDAPARYPYASMRVAYYNGTSPGSCRA